MLFWHHLILSAWRPKSQFANSCTAKKGRPDPQRVRPGKMPDFIGLSCSTSLPQVKPSQKERIVFQVGHFRSGVCKTYLFQVQCTNIYTNSQLIFIPTNNYPPGNDHISHLGKRYQSSSRVPLKGGYVKSQEGNRYNNWLLCVRLDEVRRLPKVELHAHLSGSITQEKLWPGWFFYMLVTNPCFICIYHIYIIYRYIDIFCCSCVFCGLK